MNLFPTAKALLHDSDKFPDLQMRHTVNRVRQKFQVASEKSTRADTRQSGESTSGVVFNMLSPKVSSIAARQSEVNMADGMQRDWREVCGGHK